MAPGSSGKPRLTQAQINDALKIAEGLIDTVKILAEGHAFRKQEMDEGQKLLGRLSYYHF